MHKKKDLWLEAFCPEQSCLSEEERLELPEKGSQNIETSRWLTIFCPQRSCETIAPSQLP